MADAMPGARRGVRKHAARHAASAWLIGILLSPPAAANHAQPAGAPDDGASGWHFDGSLLDYGDRDTDGNALYVVCEAGRLRASVRVSGADLQDGRRVRMTFASNSARVTGRATLALSDLDMYAVARSRIGRGSIACSKATGRFGSTSTAISGGSRCAARANRPPD